MRRGIVTFLVLLAFVPSAIYAVSLYQQEIGSIRETKQFFLEQQAITVQEQDIEESFWRVVEQGGDLRLYSAVDPDRDACDKAFQAA